MMKQNDNEYKTLAQIEAETDNEKVRFSRPLDYVREMAVIAFLKELESTNEDFRLMCAHPALVMRRNAPAGTKATFSIGLWANFALGNVHYSLSLNENVFFPVRFFKSWRTKSDPYIMGEDVIISEYADVGDRDSIIYENWTGDTSEKETLLITRNLHTAFEEVKNRSARMYSKPIPAYRRTQKQEIYRD